MSVKIQNLSELACVLSDKEKTAGTVFDFFKLFRIGQLLKQFESAKTKGTSVSTLVLMLCINRLQGLSIWGMRKTNGACLFGGDENSFYRLMNNPRMDWRRLLMSFAKQFVSVTQAKGGHGRRAIRCFIIDDIDIEKTGRTIEFMGKVFNHVTHQYTLGFKMLTLGYWDGKSLITADFSLHREAGSKGNPDSYRDGMSEKELKAQYSKKRTKDQPAQKRVWELDQKKTDVAISMLKRAVKNGLAASYVLMDSWFVNDGIIKAARSIKNGALHVLGMCKMDKRKYMIAEKELNAAQIITRYERKKGHYSRKYKSHYFTVTALYKGETVKLFFIKYGNARNWTLLLGTDLSLDFVKALELYQVRWSIEVLFKECKQYLRLGKAQNTDFDGQIADATLTLITHTVLSLQKRFGAYETMGELFRETGQHLIELTFWERILNVLVRLLHQLLEILSIDIDETILKLMKNDGQSKSIVLLLQQLQEYNNGQINIKYAA